AFKSSRQRGPCARKLGVSLADWVPAAHPCRDNRGKAGEVAMKTSQERILPTNGGALPRPPELRQLVVAKDKSEPYDKAELERLTRQAVFDIVRRQAETG